MPEYEFALKFKLQDPQIDPDIYVEQLYESGCDDAIIGTGKKGYIGLDFIRESSSAYFYLYLKLRSRSKLSVIPIRLVFTVDSFS